jgi:aryl-alcohol dehydrogenase-like predicted oxidoreductase
MGEGTNERGLSRKHIRDQVHHSLRRLQVDYIDLYQCHRYDVTTPLEETCEMMNDLVRAGKILYWGVSEWNADQIAAAVNLCRARGWSVPISNQPQYSALWRRIEARVLPTSEHYGIGNVVWSPLAQGVLTGKYAPGQPPPADSRAAHDQMGGFIGALMDDRILEAVARLRPIADGAGLGMAEMALAWVLRRDELASAIVGASRPEQVHANAAASGIELGPDVLDAIDDALGDVAITGPALAPLARAGVTHRG